jgi:hypothetical protein
MVSRQHRIASFSHDGIPPTDQPLELLCEDHDGTYVIPFLCQWRNGAWQGLDTDKPIESHGAWLAGALPKSALNLEVFC